MDESIKKQAAGAENRDAAQNHGEAVAMCFSGGKDSALALSEIRRERKYMVNTLITTVNEHFDRVSMHGVRREILRRQADSIGIAIIEIPVPKICTNEVYEREMGRGFSQLREKGIQRVVFGDIFLEDLRIYREKQLAAWNLEGLFPLWKRDTAKLAQSFVNEGFKAIVVCVNTEALNASFVGRAFDEGFLSDLPPEVDPCGENGEFHTFVFDGPIFKRPIQISRGRTVRRDGFAFCDLITRHNSADEHLKTLTAINHQSNPRRMDRK